MWRSRLGSRLADIAAGHRSLHIDAASPKTSHWGRALPCVAVAGATAAWLLAREPPRRNDGEPWHPACRCLAAPPARCQAAAQGPPRPSDIVVESVLNQGVQAVALRGRARGSGDPTVAIVSRVSLDRQQAEAALCAPEAKEVFRNDKYSKFDVVRPQTLRVELICPASERDAEKYARQDFHLVRETPEIYASVTAPFVAAIPKKAIAWVYKILDGTSEAEHVCHQHAEYLLVKDYKWIDEERREDMHLLGIAKDRELRSLRDLRGEHLPMLEDMRDNALRILREKWGIAPSQVRAYLHYLPTFWHLHVHFDHVSGPSPGHTHHAEKAHLLDDVIDALRKDPDHFSKCSITFAAGAVKDAPILKRLAAADMLPKGGA